MTDRVTLEGTTVILEPLERSHAAALLSAASEDRASYAFTTVPDSLPSMAQYIDTALDDEASGSALPFATRMAESGRVVGTTRFLDLDYWSSADPGVPCVAEIGSTWLAASAQRTRVNTECKLLMLGHAFDVWRVSRVSLKTDARNQRSRQAIERIGASFEGIRRVHMPASDGTDRDSAYYSIVAPEWPGVREKLLARLRE